MPKKSVPDERFEGGLELESRPKIETPKMYRVLMHNDHYTTMEFVVAVLMRIFRKNEPEASRIMYQVHTEGLGVCGLYPAEVAETKVSLVHQAARNAGFPLRCSMEED